MEHINQLKKMNQFNNLNQREMIICNKEICIVVNIQTNDISFVFEDLMLNEEIIGAEFTSSNGFIVICTTMRIMYVKKEEKRIVKIVVFSEIFSTLKIQSGNVCSFAVAQKRDFECSVGLDNGQVIFIEAEQPSLWN